MKTANAETVNRKDVKRTRKRASVMMKLVVAVIPFVFVAIIILLCVVYVNVSRSLSEKSETLLHTTSEKTIQEAEAWINKTMTALEQERDTIEYFGLDVPEMQEYIRHTYGSNDAYPAGIYVALTDGSLYHTTFVPGPDYNALEKSWYQDGIKSKDFILGDVYFDEDSQSNVVGASGMLRDSEGNTIGVVAADVYLDTIGDIVKNVQIEETGSIFLVDTRTFTIIGHKDPAIMGKIMTELNDYRYQYVLSQIRAGKTGLSLYDDTYVEFSKIPNSDWVAVTYVPRSEVLQDVIDLFKSMILRVLLVVVILTALVVFLLRKLVGKPVKELNRVASEIADGNLEQTIQYSANDDLGELADNFNRTTVRLREYTAYIEEISRTLEEIASGNLNFTLKHDYTGHFSKIKVSLERISLSLSDTIGRINSASRDVSMSSEHVSIGSQGLSQGAAEQASAIEELAATISEVSQVVQENALSAQKASEISQAVEQGILTSNEKMQTMTAAIQKISDKSAEISTIIKTIEDIAFQTNILALNAAVEAARAGTAGKGFAVVADEVRSLAANSSSAAQETTALIDQTVSAVQEGITAADDVAKSLVKVVEQSEQVAEQTRLIALHSEEQSVSIDEIVRAVDQVSSVVQTNSATAEESAAASEELSAQAELLKNLVSRFQLKENQW